MINKDNCRYEIVSNLSVGVFLLVLGLAFLVLALTVIPVIGFVVAVPVLIVSGIFLRAHRSQECMTEN